MTTEFKQRSALFCIHIFLFISLLFIIKRASCWQQWNYETTFLDSDGNTRITELSELQSQKKLQWEAVLNKLQGGNAPPPGYLNEILAPRPRRGHSLVLATTSTVEGVPPETYLVLFGGRDNDGKFTHIPKTYNVEKIDGSIQFTTYDDKPFNACDDVKEQYFTAEERKNCVVNSSLIDVGIIYNDVWAYRLCHHHGYNLSDIYGSYDTIMNPKINKRYFDGGCEYSGWALWNVGAPEGGCNYQLGILVCNTPSERYNHAVAMFDDGCMYVYGGYSQRCQDFCDDVWFFDIYMKSWRQVYASGALSKLTNETWSFNLVETYMYNSSVSGQVPKDNSSNSGPGRRWRHSMVTSKPLNTSHRWYRTFGSSSTSNYRTANTMYPEQQLAVVFGGHRLWHGYSARNAEVNNWADRSERPAGGYLDELWVYTKWLDGITTKKATFLKNDGFWEQKHPKVTCDPAPGDSWDSRFDQVCSFSWPEGRGGHGSVFDDIKGRVWIFGGYSTYFPYLSTDGPGSGYGPSALGSGGYIPYPGYSYFKNDIWYYDIDSGLWTRIVYPSDMALPKPRADMGFVLLQDNVIFMHGGFGDNNYFADTWYFNMTTERWLEKKRTVYPDYPSTCSDDEEYIITSNSKDGTPCTMLLYAAPLERNTTFPYEPIPADGNGKDFYWTDDKYGPGAYWPLQPKGSSSSASLELVWNAKHPFQFPFGASGPRQYGKNFTYFFEDTGERHSVFEACTSVFGEPTRGRLLDGLAGRANASVFIAQMRRMRPGWDGCRTDVYKRPYARAGHRIAYSEVTGELFMYGGTGYDQERDYTQETSWPTVVRDDMWYYNLNYCVNNCSSKGDCYFGFCVCFVGYYGEDCSNTSCPGTFCTYNSITLEQVCVHGCSAGYMHTDNDTYVQSIAKLPCSFDDNYDANGEVNGICDGFGTSQCAPPFLGDDCSIKDCRQNCSFNGWCSVEYPVSRCMCIPGYFGDICEHKLCLNNCSFPNGLCNTTTGDCNCRMMYSPYNSSLEFHPWAGEDCSFLHAYSSAFCYRYSFTANIFVLVLLAIALWVGSTHENEEQAHNIHVEVYKHKNEIDFIS